MQAKNPSRSVLVMRYSDIAPLGNLGEWLVSNGFETTEANKGGLQDALHRSSFDAVVLLGSEASVFDKTQEWISRDLTALKSCIDEKLPAFGICFGAQMLATALGGTVSRGSKTEFGWHDVSNGGDILCDGPWFQWHHDWISLQDESWLIAGTAAKTQAFRTEKVVGVQFHPEVTAEIVDRWLELGDEKIEGFDSLKFKVAEENNKYIPSNATKSFNLYDDIFSYLELIKRKN